MTQQQPLSEWLAGVKGRVAEAQETRTELRDARDSDCFDFPLSAIEARRLEAEFGDALDNLTESAEADLARAVVEIERLLERLTLTPERIEAATRAYRDTTCHWSWSVPIRAALLAAGFVEEAVTKGDE